MKRRSIRQAANLVVSLVAIALVVAPFSGAQQSAIVPTLVNFSGTLTDANGKPFSSTVGVTFYLYRDQQDGAPLWVETQNVQVDKTGHYTVTLGATKSEGLPTGPFASGEARWLGVQAQGQAEQPRVLLLSVPYALKAGDAQTIGGLPPSAFVLAPSNSDASSTYSSGSSSSSNPPALGGSGKANYLPIWTNSTTLGDSVLFQSGAGAKAKVGIGATKPASTLDVMGGGTIRGLFSLPATGTATASAGFNSQPTDLVSSAFNSGTSTAVSQTFQWQAEPVGNNTNNVTGSLNLLFGQGTNKPAETGLNIASNGQITFAKGQTFPGTGDITGVTAGTDLTGGGNNGNVTLNLDTSKVPTLGAKSNTFTGSINASSFTGDGAGLTNVNAAELGGVAPANYARLDLSNIFAGYVASESNIVADWLGNNSGGISPGLQLGFTGEAITSKQTSGGNQYGMDFWTNSADQMSITSSGSVGIGTTQPYTKLHVRQDNSGGLGPSLTLMNGGGGAGSAASIDFDGYDPGNANSPTVRIQSIDDGNDSSNLSFLTKIPGSTSNPLVEQMRLVDNGSLIIDFSGQNALSLGTGSPTGNALIFGGLTSGEGIASCRVSGSGCTDSDGNDHQYGLDFYTSYTRRMTFWNHGDMQMYGCTYWENGDHQGSCTSDARLKTDIQPFPNVLDKLAKLKPVHFDWKPSAPPELHHSHGRQYGFIAQEVEKIFPDMVSTGEDGYKRVNYGQLPYLLLQGVRELKASNDKLSSDAEIQRTKTEHAQAEVAKLRRTSAGIQAKVARLDRSNHAKDAQLAAMSRHIEQLMRAQQQMSVMLARFASTQNDQGKARTAESRSGTKSVPARDGELARARF